MSNVQIHESIKISKIKKLKIYSELFSNSLNSMVTHITFEQKNVTKNYVEKNL